MKMWCQCVVVVAFIVCANAEVLAAGPPPMELLDGTAKMAPLPHPEPTGPPIGINVRYYNRGGLRGVLVQFDKKRRDMWYLSRGKAARAKFAPGRDVISKVNDHRVSSANDVLKMTNPGWNSLRIKDLRTGTLATYWVELP